MRLVDSRLQELLEFNLDLINLLVDEFFDSMDSIELDAALGLLSLPAALFDDISVVLGPATIVCENLDDESAICKRGVKGAGAHVLGAAWNIIKHANTANRDEILLQLLGSDLCNSKG